VHQTKYSGIETSPPPPRSFPQVPSGSIIVLVVVSLVIYPPRRVHNVISPVPPPPSPDNVCSADRVKSAFAFVLTPVLGEEKPIVSDPRTAKQTPLRSVLHPPSFIPRAALGRGGATKSESSSVPPTPPPRDLSICGARDRRRVYGGTRRRCTQSAREIKPSAVSREYFPRFRRNTPRD